MRLYHGPEGIDCWRECEQPCVVVHWQLRERCCSEVYTCVGMDPGHRTCRLQHGCTFCQTHLYIHPVGCATIWVVPAAAECRCTVSVMY